ncbi:MAG: hypothetical protein K6C94_00625 [Candidatus Gastranaerophilales bacterium]|nr:hypothetical protein [Candidatus Gastranaerophilales bacterium]
MINIQSVTAMNMINAVNAQANANTYNMDGKIFVSTDMLNLEKTQTLNVSDLMRRLETIDHLSKDKNSSQSLPFADSKMSSDRREYQQPQMVEKDEKLGKLLNVYA